LASRRGWRLLFRGTLVSFIGAALLTGYMTLRPKTAPVQPERVASPIVASTGLYATSTACRSCHPAEHASWHSSYHRSMTEVAAPGVIRAPAEDVRLTWRGREYGLSRRGDEFWARLPDPDESAARARAGRAFDDVVDVERRIVMTTGSHHYQTYWVPGVRGNELWQFPFIYHFESQRFIPRHDAFLQPPEDPVYWARWNSNCIQCHSVAGEPRHDPSVDRFESRAAELGIACEACHGPGAEHVRRHQSSSTRAAQRDGATNPSIIHPGRLDPERASEVCGQCHSYFVPNNPDQWWESGFTHDYRPGDALAASRRVLDADRERASTEPSINASLDSLFYPDGTIRVGGREWNGLKRSACFEAGSGERRLSCLSCHQMHGANPSDQLGEHGEANSACRSCHEAHVTRAAEHSHHAEPSSGSQCVNCHMPHTTYALLKGIRSHRITRPVVDVTPGAALNACNLCHQNQSLAWTSEWLERWYGQQPESGAAPAERWSATAVALLSGDAAARVIAAHQLGWVPAREVSGQHWQALVLSEALGDPYAAVRFVAHRSLLTQPGFEDFSFDFLAEPPARAERQAEARGRARELSANGGARRSGARVALPVDAAGAIDPAFLEQLIKWRDERPIRISE
jgi:hypothetical protein